MYVLGSYFIRSFDMNLDDQVPIIIGHVLEADISQDACIVQEYVDSSEFFDRCLNDLLAILDAVVIGDGLAACLPNLVDDYIGSL